MRRWLVVIAIALTTAACDTPTAEEKFGYEDGEKNPLIDGNRMAISASYWRSTKARGRLEAAALAGDAQAAFELHEFYAYTTDDEATARKWLETAAKGGHETARRNLAMSLGREDCARAKSIMADLAKTAASAEAREEAARSLTSEEFCS